MPCLFCIHFWQRVAPPTVLDRRRLSLRFTTLMKVTRPQPASQPRDKDGHLATLEPCRGSSPDTILTTPITGSSHAAAALKTAHTFYRRTGALLLEPKIPLSSPYDREIWSLFSPALVALVLEPVQAAVDAGFVGHLGPAQLGAVGFGTVLFQFALGFFAALIFATTPAVAAAAASGNKGEASRAAARGIWIGIIVGFVLQAAVWVAAPSLLTILSSDLEVAGLTTHYLRARSWGIPAALVMMVGIGASRGRKDMTAPLVGSFAYLIALAALDAVFIYGFGAGTEGSGAAAAVAQWVGAASIIGLLVWRAEFDVKDLGQFPSKDTIVPYLRMAPHLAVNNIAALTPMLVASSLITGLGPDALAAHTVLRQISTFWVQLFVAFNATAHALIASSLGDAARSRSSGMDRAAAAMERICQLAVAVSVPLAVILFASRSFLPLAFTPDSTVVTEVVRVLPLLLAFMPVEALGITLEGGILGAADTRWIAMRATASSMTSLVALYVIATGGRDDLAIFWGCLKVLNVAALLSDLIRFMGPVVHQARRRRRQ